MHPRIQAPAVPQARAKVPSPAISSKLLSFVFSLVALFLAAAGAATPTPAGTVLSNQARALIDGEEVVPSNRVDTVILAVCRAQLSPAGSAGAPGQSAVIVAPSTAYLPYLLSNQGNVAASFVLGHTQAAGGAWSPDALIFFEDLNANGLVDANEPSVRQARLAAGAFLRLVMAVTPPAGALGAVAITPGADCGDLPSNEAFARIEARSAQASALRLQLAADDLGLQPSGARRFAIVTTVANYGGGDAAGAWLELDLGAALTAGLALDVASLAADKGTLTVESGGAWRPAPGLPGARVTRLRLELAGLAPDEAAELRFALDLAAPGPGALVGIGASAGVQGPDAAVHAVGYLLLEAVHAHGLERLGAPQIDLIAGQTRCVPFRLENRGTAADRYRLVATTLPDLAGVRLVTRTTSGLPLAASLPLAAGASLELALCVEADAPRDAAFTVGLRAVSEASGEGAEAAFGVARVAAADALVLMHFAEPLGTVPAGSEITYRLTVRNGYAFPLSGVRVRNDLDPDLVFVGGSDDYTEANHVARWALGTLEPGATAELRLTMRVDPLAPDDTVLTNRFALTSAETPDPVLSSTLTHATWSNQLLLETTVTPTEGVTLGDALGYTLTVSNPSTAPLTVRVDEQMAPGVDLLDLDAPGVTLEAEAATPSFAQSGSRLSWSGLTLPAGGSVVLHYRARILPHAPQSLTNSTVASGASVNGAAVASAVASTSVSVSAGVFERDRGVLLGRVYLDRDGKAGYAAGVDEPLAGVRLILGGGVQALSDASGLYAFRDLEVGVRGLLVDPASLPFELVPVPNAIGPYRFAVPVHGVSVQDVAALAPAGAAAVDLGLQLRVGPLTVVREIVAGARGDEVRLELRSSEPLHDLVITDRRADGSPWRRTFALFEGTASLSFEAGGSAADVLPDVRWRYP